VTTGTVPIDEFDSVFEENSSNSTSQPQGRQYQVVDPVEQSVNSGRLLQSSFAQEH
jgi:hypothetical protein